MKRRHVHWWLAAMLPGFFLRALIPVGFMPMAGPGYSVQLVMCDGYAPVPMMSMPMDMPMDHGMATRDVVPATSGGGTPAHQDHGGCPYGSSPALGALPTLTAPIKTQARAVQLAMASPQITHFEAFRRAQSARAPPA